MDREDAFRPSAKTNRYPAAHRVAALSLMTAALLALSACSSNSSAKPTVGAISFSDVNGTVMTPLKQLTVGESTYLQVNVANDAQLLGADWSSYCGSALPPGTPLPTGQTQDESCGSFTPGHTISGPVPSYVSNGSGYVTLFTAPAAVPKQGTVTLYATSTSDRSSSSNVTITISALAISIQLAPAPPATLAAGATTPVKAVVNNDALNGGVTWSVICGASDCGSFAPTNTPSGVATTYTAPAVAPSTAPPTGSGTSGDVQITATSVTDPTKAVSSIVSITAPPGSM